jgi:methylmalonyl-CoA mutase
MAKQLFNEFEPISSKQWKQQIQYDLKGADYNETLVWESPEGIKVKPFYHVDEEYLKFENLHADGFKIIQNIFVHDILKSNLRAIETLQRGAESVRFTLEKEDVNLIDLMQNLPKENVTYYFNFLFLSADFIKKVDAFATENNYNIVVLVDPIGQLAKDGNWFESVEKDFKTLQTIAAFSIPFLTCKIDLYQNAGANMVQQLAYAMAQANEYFNRLESINTPITFEISVGTNYFFEIAKIRALRLLFQSLAKEYNHSFDCHIIASPTKRNKTLYDYNVNLLRTTTECMSAILGGADGVSNLAYDALYHKDNEFGDRIARNQLLVLKHESYFNQVHNPADGAYYIESLSEQMAEKALLLFKDIEANGGLITQLIEGTIQRKINESAQKEQEVFDSGKEVLLGTNKYPNKNDKMNHELELFPFVKNNPRKTLITPIIERRLAEKIEQERLKDEKNV